MIWNLCKSKGKRECGKLSLDANLSSSDAMVNLDMLKSIQCKRESQKDLKVL